MSAHVVPPHEIRRRFAQAMSRMYRQEVPAYGTLMELVAEVNRQAMAADPALREGLEATDSLDRISEERHGAIRLGTPAELATMRRVFAVMGMYPVGYYDLSAAGIPVHATAFRPMTEAALKTNPFRVFTSLLRLDLVADPDLRADAEKALSRRDIFTPGVRDLIGRAERQGGLSAEEAETFIQEALETFRWHDRALVSRDLYERLHRSHRLLADVVSFRGPHINHLTPRTLDIDRVQELMPARGIAPKETIEGPPRRRCPILLRQTSFKALEEPVAFRDETGAFVQGTHTARFGEIEQRGVALTPAGRALYDQLLARAQARQKEEKAGPAAAAAILADVFSDFPDSYAELRARGLAYFEYAVAQGVSGARPGASIEDLVAAGDVVVHPIVYEDFLPVSAAGIFQSNLGEGAAQSFARSPNREAFEAALGAPVADEFRLYEDIERASIDRCLRALGASAA